MNNWFTVKVRYTKQLDKGTFKRVTEPYLVAAMTFTDAEARIYEELGSLIKGEFRVVYAVRTELHDIFNYDDADVWYKVKISYEMVASDIGEGTKKTTNYILVSAQNVKEAYDRIKQCLEKLMVDYKIHAISESPIIDIYPYKK